MVLSIFSAFIGTYLFLKNHFAKISALVGAVLYIYNPYFLWDLYKRGSVGEVLALGIVPFVLYFIDSEKRVVASILTALLITSHNTLAILFLPFILLYFVLIETSRKTNAKVVISRLFIFLAISLGISAFFWLPIIFELPLTVFSTTTVSEYGKYFVSDSAAVGIIPIFVLIASIIVMLIKRTYSLVLYFMVIVAIISVFFSWQISSFFWTDQLLGKFVQFPFRFLSLFVLAVAYLGAFVFSAVTKYIPIFAFFCIGFIIVAAAPFIKNIESKDVRDDIYSTNMDTTTVKNEYMPIWVKDTPRSLAENQIERVDESTVQINTIYWPGHIVRINEEEVPIDYSTDQGVMRVETGEAIGNISVSFGETGLRKMGDIISIIAVTVACVLVLRKPKYV
jgi:hypothetical protein